MWVRSVAAHLAGGRGVQVRLPPGSLGRMLLNPSPARDVLRRRVRLPPPEPYTGPDPCPACGGDGVTGQRYEFDPSPRADTPVLVVDVFCPACLGCGQAGHATCQPDQHADSYRDDFDRDEDYDDEDDYHHDTDNNAPVSVCPSCRGRRWWCCQGFGGDPVGEVMHELRVACGCATELLVNAD
jgi:hypothetical protein